MFRAILLVMTYIEIQTPARRLETSLDEIARPLGNAVERLRADNVCVGVAVCEDALSSCVLRKGTCQRYKGAGIRFTSQGRLTSSLFRVVNMVLDTESISTYTQLHLSRTRISTSCHKP